MDKTTTVTTKPESAMTLRADPKRARHADKTGIYVRAMRGEKHDSVDIAELDGPSLLAWLRKDGGHNPLAENCVARLLGQKGNIA